jgi:hypothetical protein
MVGGPSVANTTLQTTPALIDAVRFVNERTRDLADHPAQAGYNLLGLLTAAYCRGVADAVAVIDQHDWTRPDTWKAKDKG